MKKVSLFVLLSTLLLNSCAPATTIISTVMPTATLPIETNAPELTPTPENEKPSVELLNSSVEPYAKACELDSQQVINRLVFVKVQGKDGHIYQLIVDPGLNSNDPWANTPLLIRWNNGKGELVWSDAHILELSNITKINFLVSLPEDWYFNGGRSRELTLASENFNGVSAQGLYLLWQKPLEETTESDFRIHDAIFSYAQKNNMSTILGQHLVWGYPGIVPDWLKQKNKQELLDILGKYIQQVVARYPDVTIWSVVNEPYAKYDGGSSNDFWGQKFGENDYSWIETAFNSAHQVNPNAKLILNDFAIEIPGTTGFDANQLNRIIKIGQYLKNHNVPISGIGLQMHMYAKDFSSAEKTRQLIGAFAKNIKLLEEVYGEVMITELDLIQDGPNQEMDQARGYDAIVNTALDNGITTIDVFGITDPDSWKPDNKPLLFDASLNPKTSYYAVLQALYESLKSR